MLVYAKQVITMEEEMSMDRINELIKNGWIIESIDDKEVLGKCEACGNLILDGDDYSYCSEDSIYMCLQCCKDVSNEK